MYASIICVGVPGALRELEGNIIITSRGKKTGMFLRNGRAPRVGMLHSRCNHRGMHSLPWSQPPWPPTGYAASIPAAAQCHGHWHGAAITHCLLMSCDYSGVVKEAYVRETGASEMIKIFECDVRGLYTTAV